MWNWLKSLFRLPEPAGPAQLLRAYDISEATITKDGVSVEADSWRVECEQPRTVRLFEIPEPGLEQCYLAFRAQMRSENLEGRAYLEMWCRVPARGEFFSKAYHNAVEGTNDWVSCEAPFFLKRGQRPDLIKLNVVLEGPGTVWVKDVHLLSTALK